MGEVQTNEALRPCVVFGQRYPAWLPVLQQMGYRPVLVFLREKTYLAEVQDSTPEGCVILVGHDWRVYGSTLHAFPSTHTAFVDGKPSAEVFQLCAKMTLSVLFGIGAPRKVPPDWTLRRVSVDHHLVGGVTTAKTFVVGCILTNHVKEAHLHVPPERPYVARDLSTVLDATTAPPRSSNPQKPSFSRAAEQEDHLVDFEVRNLGTEKSPIYHGGGWLPAKTTPTSWVKTPSVFVTGNKWALRPLEAREFLYAHDWGEAFVKRMAPSVFDDEFPVITPGNSLISGMRRLSQLFVKQLDGGSTKGGDFLSPLLLAKSDVFLSPSLKSNEARPKKSVTFSLPTINEPRQESRNERTEWTNRLKMVNAIGTNLRSGFSLRSGLDAATRVEFPAPKPQEVESKEEDKTNTGSDLLDEISREKRERKATKEDDAATPIFLWTEHYFEESTIKWKGNDEDERCKVETAMEVLREKLFLWKWKRKLMKEFNQWISTSVEESGSKWLKAKHEPGKKTPSKIFYRYRWEDIAGRSSYQEWYRQRKLSRLKDFLAGSDAIQRACRSSWWDWLDGSRPFHWRWPEWYQTTIRDGLDVHLQGVPPSYHVKQQDERDASTKEKVKAKLEKVRVRRYIAKGYVVSLTSFFSVPKGDNDIRMVYDGTKSGLNESMWVPRFGLPTIDTHLRSIDEGTFLADVDVGDCFLNFPLHEKLQALAGVDLTCYFPNPDHSVVWECWHRALMGVKSSPYQAVQGMSVAEEVIRGNPTDESNVFRWDSVRMNCPGSPTYDPSKPWVSKVRKDGQIAADLVGYVDDLRPSGSGRSEAWAAARRTASVLNSLGIQDAARKRRDASRTPGAWAGSVVVTKEDGVFVLADAEKWTKAKAMVKEVMEMIRKDPNKLNRKRLESIRGFLLYVVRTYPALKPYMMGLHLTIDGWRPDRDGDGWRLTSIEIDLKFSDKYQDHSVDSESPDVPRDVKAQPRLLADMKALELLMEPEKPILRRVRSKRGRRAIYTFGDASEAGFGRTIAIDGKVYYQFGQWDKRAKGKSSNWREAQNLLDGLEMAAKDYALGGLEIFIFTDNTAAEGAFWKGTSPSKMLADIVLKMRQLEMRYDLIIHVTHVSGKRMINQGTDGLSRADQSTGVMAGSAMEDFIPLDETALDRSETLKAQLQLHLGDLNFHTLKPEEWFDEHHNFGNYIWAPPPAAADVVVDLLNKARHKRPESMHVVLVPRLMTGRWRKLMKRLSDFYFVIDWLNCWDQTGNNCWTKRQGYCQVNTCRKCVTVKSGIFCGNYLSARGRFAPCQTVYCADCYTPRGQKPFLIRELLDENGEEIIEKEDNRYRRARAGDPFMVPFQCDLCHFRNIMKRNPWEFNPDDMEILEYIRRANLDAFWSRETSTVKANFRLLIKAENSNDALNMPPLVKNMGPFPLEDLFGMQAAIAVLIRSLDKGKYETFVQWETFRKTRSAVTNAYQASVDGLLDVIGAYEKNRCWVSRVPTHSFFFVRFMEGLHRRVGEVIKQDWPIPIQVVKYIDESLNELWPTLSSASEKLKVAQMAVWFICGFCTGLRGEEMLMIELAGTADRLRYLENPEQPYFELRIRGRTKGIQMSGSNFGLPCVAVTGHSKLEAGRWIQRLVTVIHQSGRTTGRLFERNLRVPRLIEFEDDWYSVLENVQHRTDLIEDRVNIREDAGILRTLRRGVTSHATNRRVEEPLIHAINRWRSEKGGAKKSNIAMVDRYAELGTLTPTYLRFSEAL